MTISERQWAWAQKRDEYRAWRLLFARVRPCIWCQTLAVGVGRVVICDEHRRQASLPLVMR